MVQCCEDGSSTDLAGTRWDSRVPWAAVVDGVTHAYVDVAGSVHEDANTVHICRAPGWNQLPPVPLYEGPDKHSRLIGRLDPGTPTKMLGQSRDGCWVRVEEEADSDKNPGRTGWINARSVSQQVVNRLCARVDLGRPSIERVHDALSRNRGDLTNAVKDLRFQYARHVNGREPRVLPPRIPVQEIAQAAIDSTVLSPDEKAKRRSNSLATIHAGHPQSLSKIETTSARADLV